MEEVSNFSPEMAVPMTVKMPEPMTAPMPSEVSESGPSVFLSRVSGFSDSLISLSIDLQENTWGGRVQLLWAILLRGVYQGLRVQRDLACSEDCASSASRLQRRGRVRLPGLVIGP
jgi:hypothetical protein